MKRSTEKQFLTLVDKDGYPAGNGIFYECLACGTVLQSLPLNSTHCQCRNVMIDVDYGIISFGDLKLVRAYREQ